MAVNSGSSVAVDSGMEKRDTQWTSRFVVALNNWGKPSMTVKAGYMLTDGGNYVWWWGYLRYVFPCWWHALGHHLLHTSPAHTIYRYTHLRQRNYVGTVRFVNIVYCKTVPPILKLLLKKDSNMNKLRSCTVTSLKRKLEVNLTQNGLSQFQDLYHPHFYHSVGIKPLCPHSSNMAWIFA